ncbi:MAG: type II secretion system protein [Deltaproteobacteria bacterium]|nr:type II secretion system protein [Deltaproteobacteria bacterium]
MKPIFKPNGRKGGFTLLEVLIAMMILTISLAAIFQLFSGGLRSAKLSDGYTRAIFHARAKMEETLLADRLMLGEAEGVIEEDYGWRLSIDPYESGGEAGVPSKAAETLFLVTVDIVWTDGERERTFTIRTLHMAKEIGIDEEV